MAAVLAAGMLEQLETTVIQLSKSAERDLVGQPATFAGYGIRCSPSFEIRILELETDMKRFVYETKINQLGEKA